MVAGSLVGREGNLPISGALDSLDAIIKQYVQPILDFVHRVCDIAWNDLTSLFILEVGSMEGFDRWHRRGFDDTLVVSCMRCC